MQQTTTSTSTSFFSDLALLLQNYSLDGLNCLDALNNSQVDEQSVKNSIIILNKVIKKRQSQKKGNKQDKALRKAARTAKLEKDKLAKKSLLPQQGFTPIGISEDIKCFICRGPIQDGHFFYDSMCPNCGDLNYTMRTKKRDLTGYTAIVTSGRVKIGYQIALWLLNNNCSVIVTTRFREDAQLRFQKEPNYETFKDRLYLYALDFKNMTKVSKFVDFVKDNFKEINILINNATQTHSTPGGFKTEFLQDEGHTLKAIKADLDNQSTCDSSPILTQEMITEDQNQLALFGNAFPTNEINHIPNSLAKEIDDIDFKEFIEAQVVNSWVPFILCSNLKQIMTVPGKKSFIINVSTMEGKFDYSEKDSANPHTNMAKAALNMLTRTSGMKFKKDNIYITSVDPGLNGAIDETIPLDEIDGAMRVLQPIFDDLDLYSVLLKDYKVTTW